jgi:hypothetical protein
MVKDWEKYQEEVAKFFRTLGLEALVEKDVEGIRGNHNIDVYVAGEYHGIKFNWIVECKAWKDNIPKEKVLALMSIVQDVGADKGFLLSEKGFQSGAIRLSKNNNITLTSLKDLIDNTKEDIVESALSRLSWKAKKVLSKSWDLYRKKPEFKFTVLLGIVGSLSFLDYAIEQSLRNDFPVIYHIETIDGKEVRHKANTLDEFIDKVNIIIKENEKLVDYHIQ